MTNPREPKRPPVLPSEDDVLRKMLSTPPTPHKPKPQAKPKKRSK